MEANALKYRERIFCIGRQHLVASPDKIYLIGELLDAIATDDEGAEVGEVLHIRRQDCDLVVRAVEQDQRLEVFDILWDDRQAVVSQLEQAKPFEPGKALYRQPQSDGDGGHSLLLL